MIEIELMIFKIISSKIELLEFKNVAKSSEILGDIGSSESILRAFIDFLFVGHSKLGISLVQVQSLWCLALNYSCTVFTMT